MERRQEFVTSKDLSSIYYEKLLPEKYSSKPWLVFLHGLGGNMTSWVPVAKRCAAMGYRSLLIDARGHGRSRTVQAQRSFSMERYYEDVDAVLAKERVSKFIVCGLSSGGMIALGHALHSRKKPLGMVLVSSSHTSPLNHFVIPRAPRLIAESLLGFCAIVGKPFHRVLSRYVDYAKHEKTPELFLFFYDLQNAGLDSYAYHTISLFDYDVTGMLDSLEMPVLLITGGRDWVLNPSASLEMARLIPKSKLVRIGEMNHEGVFKKPEEVFDVIKGFLSSHFSNHTSA